MSGTSTGEIETGTIATVSNRWEVVEADEFAQRYVSDGVSPGAAGAALGISRNAVLQAVKRGRLKGYAIWFKSNKRMIYLVSCRSIDEYKRTRGPGRRKLEEIDLKRQSSLERARTHQSN